MSGGPGSAEQEPITAGHIGERKAEDDIPAKKEYGVTSAGQRVRAES